MFNRSTRQVLSIQTCLGFVPLLASCTFRNYSLLKGYGGHASNLCMLMSVYWGSSGSPLSVCVATILHQDAHVPTKQREKALIYPRNNSRI